MDFYLLYTGLLVTTGGIKPLLQNVDYPSMVVFLIMLFLNITMRIITLLYAILSIGLGLC